MAELSVTARVAAPVDRVWAALTSDELARWFWPERLAASARIPPVVGGAVRIVSEPGGMGVTGVVSSVRAPTSCAFTWRWDGEDAVTDVTVTLAPDGPGTLVAVRHTGFADEASRDEHITGWNDCLARLSPYLAA